FCSGAAVTGRWARSRTAAGRWAMNARHAVASAAGIDRDGIGTGARLAAVCGDRAGWWKPPSAQNATRPATSATGSVTRVASRAARRVVSSAIAATLQAHHRAGERAGDARDELDLAHNHLAQLV